MSVVQKRALFQTTSTSEDSQDEVEKIDLRKPLADNYSNLKADWETDMGSVYRHTSNRSFEANQTFPRTQTKPVHKFSDSSILRSPKSFLLHNNTLQDFKGTEPDSVSFSSFPRRGVPLIPVLTSEITRRKSIATVATVPSFFERRRSSGDTASVSYYECVSPHHLPVEQEVEMPSAACYHPLPPSLLYQAAPNRVHKKAVITVDCSTTEILTANDMACSLLALTQDNLVGSKLTKLCSGLEGYNGPRFLDDSFVTENGELIPVYGKVIDCLDNKGEKFPVSLWIYPLGCTPCKNKSINHKGLLSKSLPTCAIKAAKRAVSESDENNHSSPGRCLAVLEPVQRITVECVLGPQGRIFSGDPKLAEVFGYGSAADLLGSKIKEIIPRIILPLMESQEDHLAGKTKKQTFFPLTVSTTPVLDDETQEVLKYELTVHVFTTISGVVTVRPNGRMHSCNAYFASALFGCLQEHLVGQSITTIIPDFYENMHDEHHEHKSVTDAIVDCMHNMDMNVSPCHTVASTSAGVTPVSSDVDLAVLVTPIKIQNGEAKRVTGLFTPLSDETVKKMGNLQSCNGAIPITSTPAHTISNTKIKEGCFWGFGKHRDGSKVAIGYQIRHLVLKDGEQLFCIWIFRDPNMQSIPHPTTDSLKLTDSPNDLSNVTLDLEPESGVLVCGDYAAKYDTLQQVGKGAFGYVRLAARKKDGLLVITKFINKTKVLADCWIYDERWLKEVPIEISILTCVRHPNIVKVLDVYQNDQYYQVVMEKHGAGMDLFEFIERRPVMDEPLLSYIYRQIVSAVLYLHSINIVHRDLKDENVIIDEKFHCKLIDFGSAAKFEEGKLFSTFCGTMEYCSPEVLMGNKYVGPELEMWSMGVLLYTLVYAESPFARPEDTVRCELELPYPVSEGLCNVISWMLHPSPEYRATITEISEHWWLHQKVDIAKYSFDKVLNHVEPHELHPLIYLKELDPNLRIPLKTTQE